jgi:serine/threonine protein kinase
MKLCDFGFSKDVLKCKEYLSKTYCGSRAYVSPEILLGLPYDAKKADVWAIGVILYIFLTGVVSVTQWRGSFQMPFKEDRNNQLILKQVCVCVFERVSSRELRIVLSIKNCNSTGPATTKASSRRVISFWVYSHTIGNGDRMYSK